MGWSTCINGIISPLMRGILSFRVTVHQTSSSSVSTAESKTWGSLRPLKALRTSGFCRSVSHSIPVAPVRFSHWARARSTASRTLSPECDQAPCKARRAGSKNPFISCSACLRRSGLTATRWLLTSCTPTQLSGTVVSTALFSVRYARCYTYLWKSHKQFQQAHNGRIRIRFCIELHVQPTNDPRFAECRSR
jgi:hypothetical protein